MADVMPSGELIDEPSDYGAINVGARLGRYELLVPIARGGMARVWAARLHGQRGFQKLVAIKTILPHLADESEFERMFLDEARIASGVHHPNVCEIYELGEDKKTLYLAMEWVSGDSLARVVRSTGKSEALDARVIARVIADACAGLHAAHELTDDDGRALGVVHRDLSPHNILLTADGTAKVADFGVAKALGQLHEATSAGQLKGKIAYMAPEQVTGDPIDRRSDVFSLGCVLYEATTGQRPFRGDGDHQVMHAVLKGEVAPPTSLLRGYPQDLERIVMRALAPQPILRFPSAERMRFALEEFLARGQLVTQSNVAQLVRARIGDQIERRKERIRQASSAGDGPNGWTEPPGGGMTPSNQASGGHRSGVKASSGAAARPLFTTVAMEQPAPVIPPAPVPVVGAPGSATIPHAGAPAQAGRAGGSHTPVSHPGAAYSRPGHAYASYPGASHPAHSPPPPAPLPFGSTALMPPSVSIDNLPPNAGPPNDPHRPPFGVAPQAPTPPGDPRYGQPMPGQHPDAARFLPAPSPFEAPAGPLSGAEDQRPSQRPAGAGSYAAAIGVGVLLAALIGVGGLFAWRSRHVAPVAAAPPAAADTATAPSGGTAAGAGTASAGADQASAEITFRLLPAEATLSVDGAEVVGDARVVPRPAMGKTITVVARANGHEEATVFVDFFTVSPVDLTLKPLGEGAAPAATAGEVDPAPPKKDHHRSKGTGEGSHSHSTPKGDPGLPPNPF